MESVAVRAVLANNALPSYKRKAVHPAKADRSLTRPGDAPWLRQLLAVPLDAEPFHGARGTSHARRRGAVRREAHEDMLVEISGFPDMAPVRCLLYNVVRYR